MAFTAVTKERKHEGKSTKCNVDIICRCAHFTLELIDLADLTDSGLWEDWDEYPPTSSTERFEGDEELTGE